MAFGARQETDGKWRLCFRKGATLLLAYPNGPDIVFASQRKAKACADALNEEFWDRYRKYKRNTVPPDWAWDMVNKIEEFTG